MRWLSRGYLIFNAQWVEEDLKKPPSTKAQSLKCNSAINMNLYFAALCLASRTQEKNESWNHYFRCAVFDKGACCILSYFQPFHPLLFEYAATTVFSTKAIRGQKQECACSTSSSCSSSSSSSWRERGGNREGMLSNLNRILMDQ